MLPRHIVLTFHCLRQNHSQQPPFHPELHIPVSEIEELILQLRERKYRFCWPSDVLSSSRADERTCSITFDDGYANNLLFLPIAEKYRVPFTVFVASFNIANQKPFVWDYKACTAEPWSFDRDSYADLYGKMTQDAIDPLMTDTYRPLRIAELQRLAASPLVRIGLHTDIHQPFVSDSVTFFEEEISRNIQLLTNWLPGEQPSTQDFAFPNGLYSGTAMTWARSRFERVYTIDPYPLAGASKVIGRISIVSIPGRRTLMEQIERGYSLRRGVYSWVRNFARRFS